MQKWVQDELVTPQAARQILEKYPTENSDRSSRTTTVVVRVLSVIASLFIGLGVILIFAYNWHAIAKTSKLALAFTPLFGSLCLAAYTLASRRSSSAWRESSGISVALSTAACLGLVGQTLQLQSDLSQFYFTWQLACIPLLFALRSRALFITLCTLTIFWTATIGRNDQEAFPIRFLASTLPLFAYSLIERRAQHSRLSTSFFSVSTIWCFSALTWEAFPAWPPMMGFLVSSATFYLWLARTELRTPHTQLFTATEVLCKLGLTTSAFMLSFDDLWSEHYYYTPGQLGIVQVIAILAVLLYLFELSRQIRYSSWHDFAWTLLPAIVALLSLGSDDFAAGMMTPYIIFLAIAAIHLGYRSNSIARLNHGLLIIVILAIIRFFDSEYSMLARGSSFIVLGLLFLFANLHFLKRRKEVRNEHA